MFVSPRALVRVHDARNTSKGGFEILTTQVERPLLLALPHQPAHQLLSSPIPMKYLPTLCGLPAVLFLCTSSFVLAASHDKSAGSHDSMLSTPDKMVWKDGPGSF